MSLANELLPRILVRNIRHTLFLGCVGMTVMSHQAAACEEHIKAANEESSLLMAAHHAGDDQHGIDGAQHAATSDMGKVEAGTHGTMEKRSSRLEVNGWIRQVPMAGMNGAAYLTITNPAKSDDILKKVTGDLAARIELHETKNSNGVMRMVPLENGLVIPAQDTLSMMPGGIHVMLMNTPTALSPGDTKTLQLHFEKAGIVAVELKVVDIDQSGMSNHEHH